MLRALLDPGDWLGMKPALDPKASPLALQFAPAEAEVRLRIGLGVVLLLVVAVAIWLFQEDGFVVFVACGFGFFGLVNLAYGIAQSGFEKSLLITDTTVFVKTRSLFAGRREWREPLANYRGVLLRERHLRRGTIGNIESTKTYHVVELAHDDPRRTVPLFVRADGSPPRDVQEAFARRFDLPALAPDRGGEAVRAVERLDSPLAQQAAPRDPGPPPSGVTVSEADGEIRIAVGPGRRWRAFAWLFWLALPLLFGGGVFLLDPMMGLVAGGMAAVFVLLILGLGRLVGGRDEPVSTVVVDADTIRVERPRVGGMRLARAFIGDRLEPVERRLRRAAVEQVRVDSYTSHLSQDKGAPTYHARLVIEADDDRLELIGTQFDGAKLEWVRDYLTGVVLPATTPSSSSASDARPAAGLRR